MKSSCPLLVVAATAATAVLGAALGAGCVDERLGLVATQSLHVKLIAPGDPGTEADRKEPAAIRSATLEISALGPDGEVDPDFTGTVQVYVQYLGGLTPERGGLPLAEIDLVAGVSARVDVELPDVVYGPTFLWVEDGEGEGEGATARLPTYATGTSPKIWYRDPYIADISTPDRLDALDVLESSPLEGKQVSVTRSRHGARGRLVVTGVFAQGYTVSDVECADDAGTPPCTSGDFDHILVFTFSRPQTETGESLAAGQFIDGFTGASQEFNGLTELSFPQTFASDASVDEARIPPPVVVDQTFLSDPVKFEKVESSLIAVDGATVCPVDNDYATYKQWKLDIGRGCRSAINVITAGVVDFDPTAHVGEVLPRVVGALRPLNIGSFNVWLLYPRFAQDLTLP